MSLIVLKFEQKRLKFSINTVSAKTSKCWETRLKNRGAQFPKILLSFGYVDVDDARRRQ